MKREGLLLSQPHTHTHTAFNTDASSLTIHLVQSDMIETQELLTAVKHKARRPELARQKSPIWLTAWLWNT